jgi:hypothetical protein
MTDNFKHTPLLLKIDDKEALLETTAEVFNNCFLNITDNLKMQIENDSLPILLLKHSYPNAFP